MNKFLRLLALAVLLLPTAVLGAGSPVTIVDPAGGGTATVTAGGLNVNAISSISGFTPGNSYATLAVTAVTGNVALPVGVIVVVYNTGTNVAYVHLGTSNAVTATTSQDAVPAGGWMAFTVGSNTWIAGITTSGTTSITISGGSGLPTGGSTGGTVTLGAGSAIAGKVGVLGVDAATSATLANPFSVQISNGSSAVTYLAPGQAAMAASSPMAIASDQTAIPVNSGVPSGTAISGIGTGTTGAVVGTLAGAAAKTTYICGFDVSAIGGVAGIGPIVVAGLVGGSFTYQLTSAATAVQLNKTFTPCIPASATNAAITVTTTADGTATAVDVNASGFQK